MDVEGPYRVEVIRDFTEPFISPTKYEVVIYPTNRGFYNEVRIASAYAASKWGARRWARRMIKRINKHDGRHKRVET